MGAPIHSQAQLVTYSWTDEVGAGQGEVAPEELYNTVFVSTNRGFLHGFDVSSDSNPAKRELFRFIPPELLSNLPALQRGDLADGTGTGKPLLYGLDSTWTVFRYDAWKLDQTTNVFERDDRIEAVDDPVYPDDDFVFLYGGMRRGGKNIYALDVSSVVGDPISNFGPKYKFAIIGGNSRSNGSPYYNMGQTWSQPTLGQINVEGVRTPVIIFAGGYAAGYYSYKWAEVLSADAFSRFDEEPLTISKKIGQEFLENILEKGGSAPAADLFARFRGREPSIEALLYYSGISAEGEN